MRWLFIGITAMALGLVAFGTLKSRAPTGADKAQLFDSPDRFVEVLVDPAATAGKRRPGTAAPVKVALGTLVDGKRASGEEGDFGKDRAPKGYRDNAAKADKRARRPVKQAFGGAVQPSEPAVPARAKRIVEEAEEIEVDEDESADDDGEPADMPHAPPPPRIVAKPAPAVVTKTPAPDSHRSRFGEDQKVVVRAEKAQAFHLSADKAEGGRKGRRSMGKKRERKRKPKSKPTDRLIADPAEQEIALDDDLDARRDLSKLDFNPADDDLPVAQHLDLIDRADLALPDRLDLSLLGTSTTQSTVQEPPPAKFLPRMCYFENTYLGGNAAWQEQLRRVREALGHLRPLRHARLDTQAFDPPTDAGMALTASLDQTGVQQAGRVVLQVGLQGSQRFGWRRPPLDVVLVVDGPVADLTQTAAKALLDRLSPRDRLGIIEAGSAQPLSAVTDLRATRDLLVDHTPRAPGGDAASLVRAMDQAGALLKKAASNAARIPGSQTVVLLTRDQAGHAQAARTAAHRLQTQGAVVSVIDLGASADAGWWAVANAGHGNFHRTTAPTLGDAFDAELATLSKVVARLLRVNVRLGPHTEGIRVIGSRILGQQEVKAVKAREKATDRNLSKTMGLKADRGDDDDGIQTVIPYFYGGDSHVILVELWVDPGKASLDSAVAEITLKYKDMVNLDNATARAAVFLDRRPKADAQAQRLVKQNIAGFAFADALERAAHEAGAGHWPAVKQTLRNHARNARDRQVVAAFEALIGDRSPAQMQQALTLASQQRKGTSNGVDP